MEASTSTPTSRCKGRFVWSSILLSAPEARYEQSNSSWTKASCFLGNSAKGPNRGELLWAPPRHARILQVLHKPRYAGAFVYGRTPHTTVHGRRRTEHRQCCSAALMNSNPSAAIGAPGVGSRLLLNITTYILSGTELDKTIEQSCVNAALKIQAAATRSTTRWMAVSAR